MVVVRSWAPWPDLGLYIERTELSFSRSIAQRLEQLVDFGDRCTPSWSTTILVHDLSMMPVLYSFTVYVWFRIRLQSKPSPSTWLGRYALSLADFIVSNHFCIINHALPLCLQIGSWRDEYAMHQKQV